MTPSFHWVVLRWVGLAVDGLGCIGSHKMDNSERTVYVSSADIVPKLQSGFRLGHSTETAVPQVLAELLQAVDHSDLGVLIRSSSI